MEKIAENTKIPNLVLNKQTSCISIQMSSGAYQVAALGLLRSVSGEKVVEYKERKAVCTKSEPRFDANSSLVESLLTFSLDDNGQLKVTIHFYHTTQKILVQGTATVPFTDSILVPWFETSIQERKDEISNIHYLINEALKKASIEEQASKKRKKGSMGEERKK